MLEESQLDEHNQKWKDRIHAALEKGLQKPATFVFGGTAVMGIAAISGALLNMPFAETHIVSILGSTLGIETLGGLLAWLVIDENGNERDDAGIIAQLDILAQQLVQQMQQSSDNQQLILDGLLRNDAWLRQIKFAQEHSDRTLLTELKDLQAQWILSNAQLERIERYLTPALLPPEAATHANPFADVGRIDRPERYFVRQRVLRPVLQMLGRGQNVSIVGAQASGKSSLLSHIYQQRDALPDFSDFIFLPLTRLHSESDFFPWVCRKLSLSYETYFESRLGTRRVLLCLDEIEEMVVHNFPYQLRAQLRSLSEGEHAPFTLLIASESPLPTLFKDYDHGTNQSPLGSIVQQHNLPPLRQHELAPFVQMRLRQAQLPPDLFSQRELDTVWKMTKGHLGDVQRALKELFDEKQRA